MVPSSREGTRSARSPITRRVVGSVVKRPLEWISATGPQPPAGDGPDIGPKPTTWFRVVITIVFAADRTPTWFAGLSGPDVGPQAAAKVANMRPNAIYAQLRGALACAVLVPPAGGHDRPPPTSGLVLFPARKSK